MPDILVRLDELLAQMITLGDSLTDIQNTIEGAAERLNNASKEIEAIAGDIENEIIPRVESAEADSYAREHDEDDELTITEEGGDNT